MPSPSRLAAVAAASFAFASSLAPRARADPPAASSMVPVEIHTDGEELEVFDQSGRVTMAPVRLRYGIDTVRTPEYDRVCTGPNPCRTSMAAGTHTFAVSHPGDRLQEASPVTLTGPSRIDVARVVTPGDTAAGVLLGLAMFAGGVAVVGAGGNELSQCGADCPRQKQQQGVAVITLGVILGLGGIAAGAALAHDKEHFEISVSPLLVSPPAGARESNGLASLRPEGIASALRF